MSPLLSLTITTEAAASISAMTRRPTIRNKYNNKACTIYNGDLNWFGKSPQNKVLCFVQNIENPFCLNMIC